MHLSGAACAGLRLCDESECREHQGFSAGSYRDVSRVALINDELWSRLFLDNREALLREIDTLIGNLEKLRMLWPGRRKGTRPAASCSPDQAGRRIKAGSRLGTLFYNRGYYSGIVRGSACQGERKILTS
ncbi:MAG: prephenate dehydrogenase dimerization domain-containing protein [Eubacteriales bacterium]